MTSSRRIGRPGSPPVGVGPALLLPLGALLAFLAAAPPAAAQEDATVRGRVSGPDGAGLPGMTVEVIGSFRRAESRGPTGAFRIRLPPGEWRLRFRRPGFRTSVRPVNLAPGETREVAVTLEPRPIELKGVSVRSPEGPGLTHEVTRETTRQVPALLEPDPFRSALLLSGVTQPNDLRGRIHLAGGASDETGVRLDGHPLQDPFHLFGLLGAFNVAALEGARLRMHRLPPSEGGHLSGVMELGTRTAAEPEHEAVASLLSSSLTTVEPELAGGFDLLASGRVTYVDRIVELADLEEVPRLGYEDALVRLGWSGGAWRAELLGFGTHNRLRAGEVRELSPSDPLDWGEATGGLRVERSTGPWRLSARASWNRATISFDERPRRDRTVDVVRDWWSGELRAVREARRWRVEAGAALERRHHRHRWADVGRDVEFLSPSAPGDLDRQQAATAAALYGEISHRPAAAWTATAGGRLLEYRGELHAAPRLSVTFRPGDVWRFTAAAGRRHQWTAQAEEPMEGTLTPPVFLLDGPRTADVLGGEAAWTPADPPVGDAATLEIRGFVKDYDDQTFLAGRDEAGFPLDSAAGPFPDLRRVDGRAWGAGVDGRLELGEAILQGSYTYQRTRVTLGGEDFARDFDTPHELSLFASAPLFSSDWSLSAAFRAHSGPPTTPVVGSRLVPFVAEESGGVVRRAQFGTWNAGRLGPYSRLDLGVRHTWGDGGTRWTLFGQVLNVTNAENPREPDVTELLFGRESGSFDRSLPLLPSFGLEVRW